MNVLRKVASHLNLADRGGLGSVSSVATDGHASILVCPARQRAPGEPGNLPSLALPGPLAARPVIPPQGSSLALAAARNPASGRPSSDAAPGAAAPPPRPPVRPAVTAVYVFLNYLGVAMGVGAKYFIEYSRGQMQFSWTTMVSSIILSAVIYPFVYKRICDPRRSGGVQYFISFQHGFFFQTLLEEIQRTAF